MRTHSRHIFWTVGYHLTKFRRTGLKMVEKPAPTLLQSIALGGMSCVFTVNFTHPIETVKTRMQVTGNGLGMVVRSTLANEGVASFWKGIVWAWGREGSYASIKLGGYAPVRDALGASGKDGALVLPISHMFYVFALKDCRGLTFF